jgi:hypothetical protein
MSYPDIDPRLRSPSKAFGVAPPSIFIASRYISVRYNMQTHSSQIWENQARKEKWMKSSLFIHFSQLSGISP